MINDKERVINGDSGNGNSIIEIVSPNGRIMLRQFAPEDAQYIFDLIDGSRDHLSQHGDVTAKNYPTVESVLHSITHPTNPDRLRFTIRTHEGVLVGSINVTPDRDNPHRGEVGYYLGTYGTGKGYAAEAATSLNQYAFDILGYQELYAKVVPTNEPSARVLLRAGYTETGVVGEERLFTHAKPTE